PLGFKEETGPGIAFADGVAATRVAPPALAPIDTWDFDVGKAFLAVKGEGAGVLAAGEPDRRRRDGTAASLSFFSLSVRDPGHVDASVAAEIGSDPFVAQIRRRADRHPPGAAHR